MSDTRGGGISFGGMISIADGNGYKSNKASKSSVIQESKAPSILNYVSNNSAFDSIVYSSP